MKFTTSKKTLLLAVATGGFILSGCSHMSNLPEQDNVKVSRNKPGKDCAELGKVEGRADSKIPKQEEALADLRQEAANKGANYVMVKEYSAMGNSVTGIAYKCE